MIVSVEPLLKWAGGKRHIAEIVTSHFPPGWDAATYHEPFAGGAAIFFGALPAKASLSDVNPHLIGFYQELKNSPAALHDAISEYAAEFDSLDSFDNKRAMYLRLRHRFNERPGAIDGAALFYALNKLCFNGLYRENSKGRFNVPFGQKSKMQVHSSDLFKEASDALAVAELEVQDFEQSIQNALEGDFVYFDPPYVPLTPTASFTSYTANGFGEVAQQRLAKSMRDLAARGVRALLSNSETPTTRKIFEGLRFESIAAPRRVSARVSGRGIVRELLIANY